MSNRGIARRAMLKSSVTGGAALALTVLGEFNPTAQNQQQQGQVPRIRLVVTGRNAQGKSMVVSDEMVAATEMWRVTPDRPLGPAPAGEPKEILPPMAENPGPQGNARPQAEMAGTGRSRFFFATFQPNGKATLANRQGFHRTQTIDYIYVLSGEVNCLLDTQEVKVKTGDALLLRNTVHAWRNDGDIPCRILCTMVGVGQPASA